MYVIVNVLIAGRRCVIKFTIVCHMNAKIASFSRRRLVSVVLRVVVVAVGLIRDRVAHFEAEI